MCVFTILTKPKSHPPTCVLNGIGETRGRWGRYGCIWMAWCQRNGVQWGQRQLRYMSRNFGYFTMHAHRPGPARPPHPSPFFYSIPSSHALLYPFPSRTPFAFPFFILLSFLNCNINNQSINSNVM